MPHVVIEYSQNVVDRVDPDALLKAAHEALIDQGFARHTLKGRVRVAECYLVGDGAEENVFIHAVLELLASRSTVEKQEAGRRVMEVLRVFFTETLATTPHAMTVEVRGIDPETHLSCSSLETNHS